MRFDKRLSKIFDATLYMVWSKTDFFAQFRKKKTIKYLHLPAFSVK